MAEAAQTERLAHAGGSREDADAADIFEIVHPVQRHADIGGLKAILLTDGVFGKRVHG